MVANLPFSYIQTVNAAGAFTVNTEGGVQGTFMDDPAARYALRSGVVAYTEVTPMWGGVGIFEDIPGVTTPPGPISQMGSVIGRATTLDRTMAGGLTGFSVFNQGYNAPVSTQWSVPMVASGMTFNFVRLGSGNRIWLACDPSLVSIEGGSVGQDVSWDFNNQVLVPYDASTATFAITSMTWAATNGGQIAVVMTVPLTIVGGVGDVVNVSGATNTGTGGTAVVNRNYVITAFTNNEHFILAAPAATGVYGTIAGSPVVNAGTGALSVEVDRFAVGNSMTVNYDSLAGTARWNYTGACALVTV